MFATLALREAAAKLLAADTATLAPAVNANKMILIKAPFSPSEALKFADLVAADFDGSTPLLAGTGTQAEALDPLTNDAIIDILPPAGGFRWETTGITNLPQTIYGYALCDNGLTTVLCAAVFETPITLTAINQRVDDLRADIRQLANSMT